MVWKEFWGVEYYSCPDDTYTTFEIFETKEKALDFFNELQRENRAYELFTQKLNTDYIYYEDNGELNYEDNHNLYDWKSRQSWIVNSWLCPEY